MIDPLTADPTVALAQLHGSAIGLKARVQWGWHVEDPHELALMVRNLIVVVEALTARVAALEPGNR